MSAPRVSERLAGAWLAVVLAGCAGQVRSSSVQLAVVGSGGERLEEALRGVVREGELPVRAELAAPPDERARPTGASSPGVEGRIATARRAYLEGELDACERALGEEALLEQVLAQGQRDLAARWLFWRVACRVAAGEEEAAAELAARFAAFGLEVPRDADAASVEVERVLSDALEAVASRPRAPLRVVTRPAGARLWLDGRPRACRTPCRIEVVRGRHVLRLEKPGFVPVVQALDVAEEATEVEASLEAAAPPRAAAQWRDLLASGERPDAQEPLAVLAQALRVRRLAWIEADAERFPPGEMRLALLVDGAVRARVRATVHGEEDLREAVVDLFEEALLEGRVVERVSLLEQPAFWVAVVGVAAAGAGVTWLLFGERPVRVEAVFER